MYYWILPLALLVFFEFIADIFSKEYSLHQTWWFWGLALLSYIIANIFWLSAIKNGSGLARGAILFSVGSAVVATIIGLLIYHEKTNAIQLVGMLLGLCSLVLIFWE